MLSPRLSFAGRFEADVSTVNNINVDPGGDWDPGWNTAGTNAFDFIGCKVTGAWTPAALADPVNSYVVSGRPDRATAKMVDLDPSCQFASELWALWVRVFDPDKGDLAFMGRYEVGSFRDLWLRQIREKTGPSLPNGQPMGARFVSTLTNVQWGPASERSPFLKALRASTAHDELSICIHQFGFYKAPAMSRFRTGTVIGSIGAVRSGEPRTVTVARRILGAPVSQGLTAISCIDVEVSADERRIALDLGHALPIDNPDGDLTQLGQLPAAPQLAGTVALVIAVKPPDFTPWVRTGERLQILAEVIPFGPDWYRNTGGIVEAPLTASQSSSIHSTDLALFARLSDGGLMAICCETADAIFVRTDTFVRRMDPGEHAQVVFYARRYGRPVAGLPIFLAPPAAMEFPPGSGNVNDPHPALFAPNRIDTDEHGRAILELRASDPGRPRRIINGKTYPVDGQVYQIRYSPFGSPGLPDARGSGLGPYDAAYVHVREGLGVPDDPEWKHDVHPILSDYAQLYPVMSRHLFDIADPQQLLQHLPQLLMAFERDIHDANYMPVTRDLSAAKRRVIMNWLTQARSSYRGSIDEGKEDADGAPRAKVSNQHDIHSYDAKRDGGEARRDKGDVDDPH